MTRIFCVNVGLIENQRICLLSSLSDCIYVLFPTNKEIFDHFLREYIFFAVLPVDQAKILRTSTMSINKLPRSGISTSYWYVGNSSQESYILSMTYLEKLYKYSGDIVEMLWRCYRNTLEMLYKYSGDVQKYASEADYQLLQKWLVGAEQK